jgi:release factor glutamine methyltransferase
MTWKDSLAFAERTLTEDGVEDARTNAEYLAAHVLSLKSRSDLRPKLDQEISDSQANTFSQLVLRRANREPLQYILGEWEFFSLQIIVGPDALIPRPETEILVEQALREAAKMPSSVSILDVGTGTGCIALAIAKHLPSASVLGIDVSSGAVELAKKNAELLRLSNASFQVGDIFSNDWLHSIPGKFDLIVSNPPYISQSEFENLEPELNLYEPRIALTDESDGLTFYKRIAEAAPKLLAKRGRLLVEVGFGASVTVEEILRSSGFEVLRSVDDLAGIPRVIVAELSLAKGSKIAH